MGLDTASLTESTLPGSPSKRSPTPKFMNILTNRVIQKLVVVVVVFYRYAIIHTEQNTLLTFKHSFTARCHLFSLHSLPMLGCFPSSIAEFVLIDPVKQLWKSLHPRRGAVDSWLFPPPPPPPTKDSHAATGAISRRVSEPSQRAEAAFTSGVCGGPLPRRVRN